MQKFSPWIFVAIFFALAVFRAVRPWVRLLRAAGAADGKSARRDRDRPMLRRRRRDALGDRPVLLVVVQHLLPIVPEGVPEQRDQHRTVLVRKHVEPGTGTRFISTERPGTREARAAIFLQMDAIVHVDTAGSGL